VVLIGTLLPLIRSAIDGVADLGRRALLQTSTFTALVAPALIALPAGALLAWKRGDLGSALRRLWIAGLAASVAIPGHLRAGHAAQSGSRLWYRPRSLGDRRRLGGGG